CVPELVEALQPLLRRVAGKDRGVQGTDRDAAEPVGHDPGFVQALVDSRLVGAQGAAALKHQGDGLVCPKNDLRHFILGYFMDHPWLTMKDWPVSAADG